LSFGTAGLRGTMNAGTNAMNVYTVAHATQGMATLICGKGEDAMKRGVVIAHDCRLQARTFAEVSAEVLCANGIKVYLFDALRPTPVLSYAIGALGCIAGINITASHNPKEYNGYKAYWEDGAQLAPEQADVVSAAIAEADIFTGVKRMPLADAIASGICEIVGDALDQNYLAKVEEQLVDPAIVREAADELSIVYTPLHGTGHKLVPEILSRIGVKKLYTVSEQMVIDGNFPTVAFPNPEYPEVFALGIEMAGKVGSDLIIATDPDADRVGVMAKGRDGDFHCLTGNQMGVLLLDYIITSLKRQNKLPEGAYAIKSIVSTEMATRVCEANGVTMFQTFTGFKFIGEKILEEQQKGNNGYLLGFEESYGYLRGDYAKDKDAVVTTMLIVEMAAYYHTRGMTLIDAMDDMYAKYGFFGDGIANIYMKGLQGLENMKALMKSLRTEPPKEIGGYSITRFTDYLAKQTTDLCTGTVSDTGMTSSDVLSFVTEAGDTIVIRPSGTEPKIKIYFLVSGKTAEDAAAKQEAYKRAALAWTEE
ncbi:MAG: phospho-sugar mutase, partial [Clostridia bacterium]|nr:phospho-sugar mutase [Clostridia bacterium]